MVTSSLTLQDIWLYVSNRSSAKKVEMDAILPYIIVPVSLIIACISPAITITTMIFIGMAALYIYSRPKVKNRSPFFFSWTISSGVTMFLVFEFGILCRREITQLENFIFLVLLTCTCYFFHKMKDIADFELATGTSKDKDY
ncbi:putative palmitoyltransferase ZDHHC23, partial [Operophtera brumata]